MTTANGRAITLTALVCALAIGGGMYAFRNRAIHTTATPKIGGDYTFCFNSSQMKTRSVAFRKLFEDTYLTGAKPYPIFSLMTQAAIEPLSHDDQVKLGSRGPFVFAAPNTMVNNVPGSSQCMSSIVCSTAQFPILLEGGQYIVQADFAPAIQAQVTDTNRLQFDFAQGVPIHMGSFIPVIPILRKDMFFNTVSISDSVMEEVISAPATSGDGALKITVDLDFTDSCDASFKHR